MDPIFAAKLGAIGLRALPYIAAAAFGFSTAEAIEHKAPWGLTHQLHAARDSIPRQVAAGHAAGIEAQRAADKLAFDQWSAALTNCRADRQKARDDAAAAQSRATAFTSQQASAAYRMGRATCGGSHVSTPNTTPGGGAPVAGGVRDPADDFAGRYAAGALAAPR